MKSFWISIKTRAVFLCSLLENYSAYLVLENGVRVEGVMGE